MILASLKALIPLTCSSTSCWRLSYIHTCIYIWMAKGETTLFHSDVINKSNFIVPMKIKWNEVEFPENWHFANAVPAIEQRFERIEQIGQYPNGGGYLIFSNSFHHSSSLRISDFEPSRASSSSIPVRTTREEEGSSSANPKNIKLTGVKSNTNVARPFHTEENEST